MYHPTLAYYYLLKLKSNRYFVLLKIYYQVIHALQSDDAIKTPDSGTNDDTITIPPPPENPPPSIPNLSEDRQKQMKRVHETKNIYTEQDTQYYDVVCHLGMLKFSINVNLIVLNSENSIYVAS